MSIRDIAEEFEETTEGFTSEGLTSVGLDVGEGTYELHLKPYHLPEVGGINVYNTYDILKDKYRWMISEEAENMKMLNEYPMNLRTVFKDKDGTHLLNETGMFLMELPDTNEIEDLIGYDINEIREIQKEG